MGFTRYFTREFEITKEQFETIKDRLLEIQEKGHDYIGLNRNGTALLIDGECESFLLRVGHNDTCGFCKTRRCDYDYLVLETLNFLSNNVENFEHSSD